MRENNVERERRIKGEGRKEDGERLVEQDGERRREENGERRREEDGERRRG